MKKIFLIITGLVILGIIIFGVMDNREENNNMPVRIGEPRVTSISHASVMLEWDGSVLYADPVSEENSRVPRLSSVALPDPNIILITDIHPDHFDAEFLKGIAKDSTVIIAPQAVADQMPAELAARVTVMKNGEKRNVQGFDIEAIPAYNLPDAENKDRHPKGRGNGYVIEKPAVPASVGQESELPEESGVKVYISGDTAGIPEMRALRGIDIAFVAMNLPYTMGIEEAADAVLEFKPRKVYPYHYRTPEGFSDVAKFKELVEAGSRDIEVVQLDWYSKGN